LPQRSGATRRPRQGRHRRLLLARTLKVTRLGANDLRLDQNIVGTADHDEMFDIVAPQKHKLTLPVQVEGIDDTKSRLAGPATARHMKPAAESEAKYEQNQKRGHKKGSSAG
jgi:hypothetical protein